MQRVIKHKVILAAVLLAAFNVHADSAYPQLTNINTTGNGSSLQSNANMNSNSAINNTTNDTDNNNSAMGGAANGGSASQSYNVDAVRQSPAVFMNAPAPTAPCQATAGGFVSFIAGGGFAASYTLTECELRETARIAHGVGEVKMAKELLCMGKFAKLTESCKSYVR